MDEVKDFANKFVKLTIAQADMQVYKHLHDYTKKYAQKLQIPLESLDKGRLSLGFAACYPLGSAAYSSVSES